MKTLEKLAEEVASQVNITAEDALSLLEGINAGKAGGKEANYIMSLELRDKAIGHLTKVLDMYGLSAFDHGGNLKKLEKKDRALKVLSKLSREKEDNDKRNSAYVILLVDDPEDAIILNSVFRHRETPYFKIHVFSAGTQIGGLQHNGFRPTHIIDAIQDRKHPDFDKWYRDCVLPIATKGILLGGP